VLKSKTLLATGPATAGGDISLTIYGVEVDAFADKCCR